MFQQPPALVTTSTSGDRNEESMGSNDSSIRTDHTAIVLDSPSLGGASAAAEQRARMLSATLNQQKLNATGEIRRDEQFYREAHGQDMRGAAALVPENIGTTKRGMNNPSDAEERLVGVVAVAVVILTVVLTLVALLTYWSVKDDSGGHGFLRAGEAAAKHSEGQDSATTAGGNGGDVEGDDTSAGGEKYDVMQHYHY